MIGFGGLKCLTVCILELRPFDDPFSDAGAAKPGHLSAMGLVTGQSLARNCQLLCHPNRSATVDDSDLCSSADRTSLSSGIHA